MAAYGVLAKSLKSHTLIVGMRHGKKKCWIRNGEYCRAELWLIIDSCSTLLLDACLLAPSRSVVSHT